MKFRGTGSRAEKIAPQMAPMIDVVFQLLIFFMLTLKIILPEGEFGINMPAAAAGNSEADPLQTEINVRAVANGDGSLASLRMGDRDLGNDAAAFDTLTAELRGLIGDVTDPEARGAVSVTIDPDYGLDYEWFIKTVGAVSGDKAPDGTYVPLIENIKFAQAREPGA